MTSNPTTPQQLKFLFDTKNGQLFTQTPRVIQRNKELTALEKDVWSALYFHGRKYGKIHPRRDTLADELGASLNGVKKALSGLKQKGFIDWKTPDPKHRPRKDLCGQQGKANEYTLLHHPSFDRIQLDQKVEPQSDGSSQKAEPQSSRAFEKARPQNGLETGPQNGHQYTTGTDELREHTPARPAPVCSSFDSTGKEAGNGRDELGSEELTLEEIGEFIQLLTEKQGRNPGAYRTSLERKLREGKLSYSRKQLEELRGATQAAQDPQPSQGQVQESEENRARREEMSKTIDQELKQGTEERALLWQVFRGELLAEERVLAESELARRIPETYEAEKTKYSLLRSARTAMHYPGQAQKRVPRIIERLEAKDSHLAGQLREEWAARRAELGLEPEGQDTGAAVEAQ